MKKALGKVTIKDISNELGISAVSVHRALRGKEGISNELRSKILETAKEMGYVENYAAASIKRKTSKVDVETLGIVFAVAVGVPGADVGIAIHVGGVEDERHLLRAGDLTVVVDARDAQGEHGGVVEAVLGHDAGDVDGGAPGAVAVSSLGAGGVLDRGAVLGVQAPGDGGAAVADGVASDAGDGHVLAGGVTADVVVVDGKA